MKSKRELKGVYSFLKEMERRFPLVRVVWEDIWDSSGWKYIDEDYKDQGRFMAITVGWLLEDSKTHVKVVPCFTADELNPGITPRTGNRYRIPKGVVHEITYLTKKPRHKTVL